MKTIKLRLTTGEYLRLKLISRAVGVTPAEFLRNNLVERIDDGLFDEMLTGHD